MTAKRFGLGAGVRWKPCEPAALRSRPAGGADVAGDPLGAPAEVVDAAEVGEHVEPLLVAQVRARLDDPRRVDDERRLAVRLERLDDPGYARRGVIPRPRGSRRPAGRRR